MNRYAGKRFAAMLSASCLLTAGFFYGDPVAFSSFATTLGLIFGVYIGGQSATDYKAVQ